MPARIRSHALLTAALILTASDAVAQSAQLSQPQAAVPRRPVIEARDVPYPGVLALEVDASDTRRGIFRVRQTIPVARPGVLTLRYPQWLPGNHGPTGPIEAVAGLTFTSGNRTLTWRRNPEDVFAFDVDVPAGVRSVEARFDYLSDMPGDIGRTEMTPDLINLQWEKMSLYPAGHFVRQIRIRPTVVLPEGWTGVSAIDGEPRRGRVSYAETTYETMVDSPMIAGRNFRAWPLGYDTDLNAFADEPDDLAASEEQIAAHRRTVEQLVRLFGTRSFDRYDFLLGLSNQLSGIGLEHHRSSENIVGRDYFTGWSKTAHGRALLPHEMAHSWIGKHRRPAELWAPDYATPTQNNLLWVYEGQTSYWDVIIAARAGMISPEIALGEFATNAATFQDRAGRRWRSLLDTTHHQIVSDRRAGLYPSYQRGTDYYAESALLWLEADMLIRELSRGQRSLDDFARTFFGGREGDWGVRTFTFEDVVAALNAVQPHGWADFLRSRVERPDAPAPVGGFARGGYRLVYRETPNAYDQARFADAGGLDLTHSLGLSIASSGRVGNVQWEGPAFEQAIRPGSNVVAVNGLEYSADALRSAIAAAKDGRSPIRLLVRDGRNV
ncbi:MAG TPA: peptidase M61, partial [Allosphingosinicella sp.]|nr:peptidase M61 [Allosphingosinicella sp.]